MPPAAFVSLTDAQVRARFQGLTRHLDHWGDVIALDAGAMRATRLLEFRFVSPGNDLEPDIRALYREYYVVTPRGQWDITKYTYEYLDLRRGWRLAYHLHDLGGRRRVAHAHCEPASAIPVDDRSAHLRATEYELREAHAEFMRLYAADLAPDCDRFLPLAVPRT